MPSLVERQQFVAQFTIEGLKNGMDKTACPGGDFNQCGVHAIQAGAGHESDIKPGGAGGMHG